MVFPERFLWGVSISGFQLEMGHPSKKDLDPNSDWYAWVHDSGNIRKGLVSGDLPENGVNYWNLYERDHGMAKELGLNACRIGIEWSRVFPHSTEKVGVGVERAGDGNIAKIDIDDETIEELDRTANSEAVNRYRAIVRDLRSKDFKVFVCLNHFTLPLWAHNPIAARETKLREGPRGWVDGKTIIEFAKYAAYMASKLGDVVDSWSTFNEPMVVPESGYLSAESGFPPGVSNLGAYGKAMLHTAVAHARAYDMLKKMDTVKADEDSSSAADVGLIHNAIPTYPLTQKDLDVKAAEFMSYMHNHFIIEASTKGWLDYEFAEKSKEAKSYMRDRLDWIGVNYYTRSVVRGKRDFLAKRVVGVPAIPESVKGYGYSCKARAKSLDGMPTSDFGWEIYPEGILDALNLMKGYGKPLYITEHGVADFDDKLRPRFIVDHLKLLERAVDKEKMDVRGYLHWALMDNYEWAKGFSMKFGLHEVDIETKKRKARRSAQVYKRIIESGGVTESIEKAV